MSRRVVTSQLQAGESGASIDGYFDKVVKYVPADIVAAWIAADALIRGSSNVPKTALMWVAFGVGLVLTAPWILRQTRLANAPLAVRQAVISTIAFALWVFAIGGPFATLHFYHPVYGGLLLIFFSLTVGLVNEPATRTQG
jgi:hypothetical protein